MNKNILILGGVLFFLNLNAEYILKQNIKSGITFSGNAIEETENSPEGQSLNYHIDFSASNGSILTNEVDGSSWSAVANSLGTDSEGNMALVNPSYGINLNNIVLTSTDWTVEVVMAPPYIVPNTGSQGGLPHVINDIYHPNTLEHKIGYYRDGNYNDGFIYQGVGNTKSNEINIISGSLAYQNYGSYNTSRVHYTPVMNDPVESFKWQKSNDTITFWYNGNEIGKVTATDAQDGFNGHTYNILENNSYTNNNINIKSLKIWLDE